MTKPYDAGELVARLQAVMRRSRGFAEPKLRVGNLELDLNGKNVTVDGAPLHLTGKEYAILELLVIRKGSVLTKDAFLNHLYGGIDEPEMKIIDVFICKLRRKLQNVGAGNLIATVWGRGYILREDDTAEIPSRQTHRPETAFPQPSRPSDRTRDQAPLPLTAGSRLQSSARIRRARSRG